MTYSGIYIIYNPNSTGDSKSQAFGLKKALKAGIKGMTITCIATQRAGHGEELACELAKSEPRPLIISASGDGGYNEVVNGVVAAGNAQAVCAVVPAGNANDHSRTVQDGPLAKAIIKRHIVKIDLLEAEMRQNGATSTRYAHSYIGLGLTPIIAVELNKHSLNAMQEMFIVVKTFLKYRPFKITHNGKLYKLDSLLFGNINQMAKVLTIAPKNRPADGKFEVILFPTGQKWSLIRRLVKAAVSKLENVQRAKEYTFTVRKNMPMQLDGEVVTLQAGSKVTIRSKYHLLNTIV
jgi:diacylglycerol kinase family enzyme